MRQKAMPEAWGTVAAAVSVGQREEASALQRVHTVATLQASGMPLAAGQ